jgi:thiol-disulfide isomerase/thioredoxin
MKATEKDQMINVNSCNTASFFRRAPFNQRAAQILAVGLLFSMTPALSAPATPKADASAPSIETTKPIPLEAVNAVENNNWKTAVTALESYLKSEPGSAEGHYLLGKSLYNEKKFIEAKDELRKALRFGHGDNFSAKANELLMQMPKAVVAPKQAHLSGPAKIRGRRVAAAGLSRPRILSFSAKWADPCKQLQIDLDKAKSEFGEQVEIFTVDVDDPKNEELMNQYEVSPIPTVVFLDAQGKVINFLIGYSDPAELERSIKKVLNKG